MDELALGRRMRVLREILSNEDNPYHSQLVGLADMIVETETSAPVTAVLGAGGESVGRRIDLLGSPPPRPVRK